MERANLHSIKSLVFDLSFDEEKKATELYHRVRDLHYQKIERIISDCLEEYTQPEQHLSLERLELDLGRVSFQRMEEEMETKIRRLLHEELKQVLWESQNEKNSQAPKEVSYIDSLQHYLKFGFLPWNEKKSVEELIELSLHEQEEHRGNFMNQWMAKPFMLKRLIQRSSDKQLTQIVKSYSLGNSQRVQEFHANWQRLLEANKLVKVPSQSIRADLWFLILAYFHRLGNATFYLSDFEHTLKLLICEKYQLPFPKTEKEGTHFESGNRWGSISSFLLGKGVNNFPSAQEAELEFEWQLSEYPVRFRKWIYRQSRPEPIIRRVVRKMSPSASLMLLKVLEPSQYEKINDYRENLIELNLRKSMASASQLEFSLVLWEIILLISVKKGTSHFNMKSFLKDLIEKTEARFQLDKGSLLAQLYQATQDIGSTPLIEPGLLGLIKEIFEEQHKVHPIPEKQPKTIQQSVWEILSEQLSVENWKEAVLILRKEAQKGKLALSVFVEMKTETLKSLLFEINPHESAQVVEYAECLVDLNQKEKWVNEAGERFHKIILSLAVCLMLEEKGSMSNQKFFLKRLLTKTSNHYNLSWEAFLTQLRTTTASIKESRLQASRFFQLLDQIIAESQLSTSNPNRKDMLSAKVQRSHSNSVDPQSMKQQYLQGKWSQEALLAFIREVSQRDLLNMLSSLLPTTFSFAKASIQILERYLKTQVSVRKAEEMIWAEVLVLAFETSYSSEKSFLHDLIKRLALELKEGEGVFLGHMKAHLEDIGLAHYTDRAQQKVLTLLESLIQHDTKPGKRSFSVGALCHLLFGKASAKPSDWAAFGFRNQEEALEFLLIHFAEEFFAHGSKYTPQKIKTSLQQIPLGRLSILFRKAWGQTAHTAQSLIRELQSILARKGHHRQTEFLQVLMKSLLVAMIGNKHTSRKQLIRVMTPLLEAEGIAEDINFSTPIIYKKEEFKMEKEIFIQNAGLVIFNGYLNSFFNRCDLTNSNGFKSTTEAHRAVNLLQYVCFPNQLIEENYLALNKLICGVPLQEVVDTNFVPTENEKETTDQMFQAIISHWEMVKNSTVEGFRESWLWREGKLSLQEESNKWELTVEQKSYDILLDYKPFSINPVSFSWMKKPIEVDWR